MRLSTGSHRHLVGQGTGSYLQLPDIKLLLKDVRNIGPCSQAPHARQVPTVATHGLDDEHTTLRPAR